MGLISVVPLGFVLWVALERLVTDLVHSELPISRIEARSLRLVVVHPLGVPGGWPIVVAWWRTSHVAWGWPSVVLEGRASSWVVATATSRSGHSSWGTIPSVVMIVI